jgi:hypothetical protein
MGVIQAAWLLTFVPSIEANPPAKRCENDSEQLAAVFHGKFSCGVT